jgi:hypothetical protein
MKGDREKEIDYKGDQNMKSIHHAVCVLHLLAQVPNPVMHVPL